MDINELKAYLKTKIEKLEQQKLQNSANLKFFDRLKLALDAFIITFKTNSKASASNLIIEYRKKDLQEINNMINTPFYEMHESLLSYYRIELKSLEKRIEKMLTIYNDYNSVKRL